MTLSGKIDGKTLHLEGGQLTLPKKGDGHTIFVRGEDVQIVETGPLQGTVETVTFLGTHYRIGISGITSYVIASIHSAHQAPKVGEKINVAITPEALMLLPKEVTAA